MSIECPACHGMTSANARSCPHCGATLPLLATTMAPDSPGARRGRIGKPTRYRSRSFVTLFMWWAIGAALVITSFVAVPAAVFLMSEPDEAVGASSVLSSVVLMFAVLLFAFTTVILQWILLFRSWAQIQDGFARTTPGAAIGLLLVPLFNLYWIFVVFRGLAIDANAYCARHGFTAPPIPVSLATTYCILNLCMFIPYVNMVAALALVPLAFILTLKIANSSAAIAEAIAGRAAGAPPQIAAEAGSPESAGLLRG